VAPHGMLLFARINEQSYMEHIPEFQAIFQHIPLHVIAVNESWLLPTVRSTDITLPDYKIFRNDILNKRGRSCNRSWWYLQSWGYFKIPLKLHETNWTYCSGIDN